MKFQGILGWVIVLWTWNLGGLLPADLVEHSFLLKKKKKKLASSVKTFTMEDK